MTDPPALSTTNALNMQRFLGVPCEQYTFLSYKCWDNGSLQVRPAAASPKKRPGRQPIAGGPVPTIAYVTRTAPKRLRAPINESTTGDQS
jgi:hypothetical protein